MSCKPAKKKSQAEGKTGTSLDTFAMFCPAIVLWRGPNLTYAPHAAHCLFRGVSEVVQSPAAPPYLFRGINQAYKDKLGHARMKQAYRRTTVLER